jgi:hypothetical protein
MFCSEGAHHSENAGAGIGEFGFYGFRGLRVFRVLLNENGYLNDNTASARMDITKPHNP